MYMSNRKSMESNSEKIWMVNFCKEINSCVRKLKTKSFTNELDRNEKVLTKNMVLFISAQQMLNNI